MTIRFVKMHGLGNDFMVFDTITQEVLFTPSLIKKWGNRHLGIGFDQCLIIEKSNDAEIDFFYRIFNADGTEVGQCGNGARCLARYVRRYGLTHKNTISIATKTTRMKLILNENDTVTVDLGTPKFAPQEIPITFENQQQHYNIPDQDNKSAFPVFAVNVGNPHAVLVVSDLAHVEVDRIGKYICHHPIFPEQVNVGFMEIIDSNHINLRVFERGCGETYACGSGAVAAMAIGRAFLDLDSRVFVQLPGGELLIQWENSDDSILLTGPAEFVYEGILQ